MKTKSKLLMISSFAIAMVASLVMAFAMMNVAKPATETVDAATSGTVNMIYFHDSASWGGTIKIYAWNSASGKDNTGAWGATEMTWVAGGYYCYDIGDCADFIIYSTTNEVSDRITRGSEVANSVTSGLYNASNYLGAYGDFVDYSLYYRNASSWSGVTAYVWVGGTNQYIGTKLVSGTTDWYKCDVLKNDDKTSRGFVNVLFKDSSSESKTSDLTINSTKHYYSDGKWNDGISTALVSVDGDKYYFVGVLNGKVGWYESEDSIVIDGSGKKVTLTEGDVIKLKKGDKWYGVDGANYTIPTTGVYLISFTEGTEDSLTVTAEAYNMQGIKNKLAKENGHLLLVSAFDFESFFAARKDDPNYLNYRVGYLVNGEYIVSEYYYTGVTYKIDGSNHADPIDSSDLYGIDDLELIVEEIPFNAAQNYTITAVIVDYTNTSDPTLLASSNTITYTAP